MITPVVDDECLETTGGLRLDPILENEAQDAAGHLSLRCEQIRKLSIQQRKGRTPWLCLLHLIVREHLKQEKNGQKYGIGRQQGCVLPEGSHTSCESCKNHH